MFPAWRTPSKNHCISAGGRAPWEKQSNTTVCFSRTSRRSLSSACLMYGVPGSEVTLTRAGREMMAEKPGPAPT